MLRKYGLCVSMGETTGRAYVLQSDEIEEKLTGDTILILKQLDRKILVDLPSNVVGIVAEKGNIGSHGAGILRKQRIPCVVRIADATATIPNGVMVSLIGKDNEIIYEATESEGGSSSEEAKGVKQFSYKNISKRKVTLENIQRIETWYQPRPDRVYQKLRFDMIKDVYAAGTEYLYGVPKTETRQSERGVLEVKGVPTTLDLCRFQIGHPDWLVEKANERDVEFSKMKKRLRDLLPMVHNPSKENIIEVFNTAVKLYQNLFTYVFLAQTTSDEVLDIYLDFLKELTGKEYSRDILEMKSDYVERCMNSEVDAGSFQSWSEKTPSPFVWEGMIDYTPFREDKGLISIISAKENSECFLEDYNSFRKIVPLLYQLSEEFFYMSRSINTFLVWGIQHLHELMQNKLGLRVSLDDFNNLSLKQVNDYILMI